MTSNEILGDWAPPFKVEEISALFFVIAEAAALLEGKENTCDS